MNRNNRLTYSKEGRLLFDKRMKKDYTILMPNMLPTHFKLLHRTFKLYGYRTVLLETTHHGIIDEGLKNVHNDTCYPALLVIGQMIDALKSGKYDPDRVALMMTQTGGGCRASNYIHLVRKALKKSGFEQVPVISLNLSGMEKNPGFNIGLGMLQKLFYCLVYGDLLMLLANQCRPYEENSGETDRLVDTWVERLLEQFKKRKGLSEKQVGENTAEIIREFALISRRAEKKIRVGIVGEIYIKYAALGNNNLEKMLAEEGVEVVVPGIMDFMIFSIDIRLTDIKLYGGKRLKYMAAKLFKEFCKKCQDNMIAQIKAEGSFAPPTSFEHLKHMVEGYVGHGNKMGEGWLLTGEMLELVNSGVTNIVCTQPFGCLPNHIVGKGMLKKIRETHPEANIVAIDYDSGAAAINQENRIKLMIANGLRAQQLKEAQKGLSTQEITA
jgi:predicted nucleotide-binding protein (sugar kinase/HSP70/actin superfamily)